MKRTFALITLVMTASHFQSLAQSMNALVLPDETNQNVRLDLSQITSPLKDGLGFEYLSVFVKNEAYELLAHPIQGRYQVADGFLVFTPFLPFEKGMTYVVKVRNNQSASGYQYQDFQIGEKPKLENAKLLRIYPVTDTLPENLLRFYFYFNTPMKKDQALQHIHLADTGGIIDSHAFMEFKQELWSADGRRLTLLFDPGRIKRGVSTNTELGPALLEGNQYTLNISGSWQDVNGQELGTSTTKIFQVEPAYRTAITIEKWRIDSPEAQSKRPLTIQFDRIMDHALIQSMIQIINENGDIVSGYWEMSKDEIAAHFIPNYLWEAGSYKMIFDPRFEDISGNNLEGLLDQSYGSTKSDKSLTKLFLIK